jgi:hypothetical protein
LKERAGKSGEQGEAEATGRGDAFPRDDLPPVLDALEAAILDACAPQEQWPAQISAGVYAGIDFVTANPDRARAWVGDAAADSDFRSQYERIVGRLAGFLRRRAPVETRLPASTDEALVAGIVGLVGDHVRIGRFERLAELRPELVLLVLLPYLGFAEAQAWANRPPEIPSPRG